MPCPIELPDKDRPVLLAAIVNEATHLITGDITHFGPFFHRRVQSVLILPPAGYLEGKSQASGWAEFAVPVSEKVAASAVLVSSAKSGK